MLNVNTEKFLIWFTFSTKNLLFILVRSLKRDESVESAGAGLLRDFDSTDYYVGTTSEINSYGANSHFERNYQTDNLYDVNSDNARSFSTNTNRVGPAPKGLFDDL